MRSSHHFPNLLGSGQPKAPPRESTTRTITPSPGGETFTPLYRITPVEITRPSKKILNSSGHTFFSPMDRHRAQRESDSNVRANAFSHEIGERFFPRGCRPERHQNPERTGLSK
jgi:hypothetical protein